MPRQTQCQSRRRSHSQLPQNQLLPPLDPRVPLVEGWLHKKNPHSYFFGLRNWRQRYFRLYPGQLRWWKSVPKGETPEKEDLPHGSLPIAAIKFAHLCRSGPGGPRPARFNVCVGDSEIQRTFELKASGLEEAERWVQAVTECVARNGGRRTALEEDLMTERVFWKSKEVRQLDLAAVAGGGGGGGDEAKRR